jgi:hypothetical protein
MYKISLQRIALVTVLFVLAACQKMGPSEYGVVFRKLPPRLGGGIASNVVPPTNVKLMFPWESVYRIDTSVRTIEWGQKGDPNDPSDDDYVQTRAKDGNEVAQAVVIQYRVSDEPEKLVRLVREIGASDDEIERLVRVVARSDVRRYMSQLETNEFARNEKKYEGERLVREGMAKRLEPYGVIIQNVNLKEHRFERQLPNGNIDSSYQERINEVQAINQQIKREDLRVETVLAEKKREYNDAKGEVERAIAESQGYKNQAVSSGDAYFAAKSNDAQAILAAGQSEVKGIIEQVNALAGPGGVALLKIELAKSLKASDSRFVLVDGGQEGINVKKVDTNELMRQIGVFEGLKDDKKSQPSENSLKQ